mmetsp:Transcript_48387/g.101090  ORF Transcript_48387/g.101090 Transcript_48387/m.101090 type:complete len:200 (+) Transcript_48387:2238-2837(+)
MATMSMMKKALHMGAMDAESAARIFLEELSRPKRRETRRARRERRMVTGITLSRGPRTTRDMPTTRRSKTDQLLEKKLANQWEKRLTQSSAAKTTVKPRLTASSASFVGVSAPSGPESCSGCSWASRIVVPKFARIRNVAAPWNGAELYIARARSCILVHLARESALRTAALQKLGMPFVSKDSISVDVARTTYLRPEL